MHRFYLPPQHCHGHFLELKDREAHHAVHVLRLAPGSCVTVLDGEGQTIACNVEEASRHLVRMAVVERKCLPPLPYRITLLQAVPKGRTIENIIEKATELGVHRIVPLLTERVVMSLDPQQAESKAVRWRQTAIEAIKQSGNPWLPLIEQPVSLSAFAEQKESFDLTIIGSLADEPSQIRERVRAFVAAHHHLPGTVSVWIGPEGDFTPAEVELAKTVGALPVSLGRLVLRCETAALYCLSVLNHELACGQG